MERIVPGREAIAGWRRRARRLGRRLARSGGALAGALAGRDSWLAHSFRAKLMERALPAGTLFLVPLGAHRLLVDPRDDKIAARILSGRAWQGRVIEQAIARLIAEDLLPADPVFVDVGANIGTSTLQALSGGAFGSAVAFEPDPRNLALLRRNVELNGLASRTRIRPHALSDRAGRATLARHAHNLGAHSLSGLPAGTAEEEIEVRIETLDAALEGLGLPHERVGLVKIDVERHEAAVLAGMPRLLALGVPLLIEWSRPVDSDDAVGRRIAEHYSNLVELSSPQSGPMPVADFVHVEDQHDVLVY